MQEEDINRFMGIPEHCVRMIYFYDKEGNETEADQQVYAVVVELLRTTRGFRCPCGRRYGRYYDCEERDVRGKDGGVGPDCAGPDVYTAVGTSGGSGLPGGA